MLIFESETQTSRFGTPYSFCNHLPTPLAYSIWIRHTEKREGAHHRSIKKIGKLERALEYLPLLILAIQRSSFFRPLPKRAFEKRRGNAADLEASSLQKRSNTLQTGSIMEDNIATLYRTQLDRMHIEIPTYL